VKFVLLKGGAPPDHREITGKARRVILGVAPGNAR
jgi:hypothetical protein